MSAFSERDVCSKLVLPAIISAGWDLQHQIREEVSLTDGRIIVRGSLVARGRTKRADVVLYRAPNVPLAVVEVKDQDRPLGWGLQQALEYAEMLDVPFVFSTNGQGFLLHDKTAGPDPLERVIPLDAFPSPEVLWSKLLASRDLPADGVGPVEEPYHDVMGRSLRYYQAVAINRAVEAIARGQNRVLLVMATGTGKTYTAFQIIWRLWKSGARKRILFLADRNILVDQARMNDFKPFGSAMTKITNREVDKSYEIYLSLYQAVSGPTEDQNIYKQFSPDFFDLVVVDECHRGSASADAAWREILDYFASATQIGMTATPRETETASNTEYFGDPVFTYSLRQGIEDGFLAPYKVIRYDLDRDLAGYRPESGLLDRFGYEVDDRIYNQPDFDRKIVIDERTQLVANKITEFLKSTNRFDKTIVFCEDTEHADRMRQALANANFDLAAANHRYVMRITGDDPAGKAELDNFIDPECPYPVIATTSKLLSTGVDAKTCKLIALDQRIQSLTEFKQIIGRGTRIDEEHDKRFFTIMDFKRATELFADPDFDGDPVQVLEPDLRERLDAASADDAAAGIIAASEGTEVETAGPRKFYVDGVEVQVSARRVQYLGADGKLITESLRSYTRKAVHKRFATLDEFLQRWSDSDRRQAIVQELEEQGVSLDALRDEVADGRAFSDFDLVCHVAFGAPPLTREQRVQSVKSGGHLARYGDSARLVLDGLLDKYADGVLTSLESPKILRLKPFTDIGTPIEIINKLFGGKTGYQTAVRDLENEIYKGNAGG